MATTPSPAAIAAGRTFQTKGAVGSWPPNKIFTEQEFRLAHPPGPHDPADYHAALIDRLLASGAITLIQ